MQRPLGNSSWDGAYAQTMGRERVGRPVTTNEERQEVMGAAWEQVPLMKGSGIVGGGGPNLLSGALVPGKHLLSIMLLAGHGKKASVSRSVKRR